MGRQQHQQVLRALRAAAALLAKQDRPKSAPRTGALYVPPRLVEDMVDKLIGLLPRVLGSPDLIDVKAYVPRMRPVESLTVRDARGTDRKIWFSIVDNKSKFAGIAGMLSVHGTHAVEATLFLVIAPNKSVVPVDELKDKWLSVLTHELAHARDPETWAAQAGIAHTSPDYTSDPREVRAFLAQMVHELQTDKAYKNFTIDVDEPVFRSDPLTWAEKSSPTWYSVKDTISGSVKKRFLRAISDVYNDVLEKKMKQLGIKSSNPRPFSNSARRASATDAACSTSDRVKKPAKTFICSTSQSCRGKPCRPAAASRTPAPAGRRCGLS